ncbi:MAG: hypothetical protein QOC96_3604 [Acidobacteriota bacterium]|jgi:hypothetical protein|nr:hypothetical protein [Acidobacteriota bacterium]
MRFNPLASSLFLALFLCVPVSHAQEQKTEIIPRSNPIEWFNEAAGYHPDTLLFKALQYTAPYPGYYQELTVGKNGHAFTGRVVPNWAVQASSTATLGDFQLDEVKRMLMVFANSPQRSATKPKDGELYTAFVLFDGKTYSRYDFIGALPAEAQAILDLVYSEIVRQGKLRQEQWQGRHDLMKKLYGDWQHIPGVIVVTTNRTHGFKDLKGLLITITGQRRISEEKLADVSVYHAIVFYPEGDVTCSGGGGKHWSDEPFSSAGVTWTLRKNLSTSNPQTEEKRLEIEYDVIKNTINIGSEVFPLTQGNMFIIRMSEKWSPIVTQINAHLNEQVGDQKVLDYYKSILSSDETIQKIELSPTGKMQ